MNIYVLIFDGIEIETLILGTFSTMEKAKEHWYMGCKILLFTLDYYDGT